MSDLEQVLRGLARITERLAAGAADPAAPGEDEERAEGEEPAEDEEAEPRASRPVRRPAPPPDTR
jgi:hypothetical protein